MVCIKEYFSKDIEYFLIERQDHIDKIKNDTHDIEFIEYNKKNIIRYVAGDIRFYDMYDRGQINAINTDCKRSLLYYKAEGLPVNRHIIPCITSENPNYLKLKLRFS